jgi:hypothetical protein
MKLTTKCTHSAEAAIVAHRTDFTWCGACHGWFKPGVSARTHRRIMKGKATRRQIVDAIRTIGGVR